MKVTKRIAVLLFVVFGWVTPVFAHVVMGGGKQDSVQILQLLKQRDKQVKDLLGPKGTKYTQQQKNKLKDMINGIVDYKSLAAVALQKTYDTLSTSKRNEFVNVFSTVVRNQSLNNLDIYRAKVDYKNISIGGDTARVKTMVTLNKTRTPVSYQMKKENGHWFITDIILDNVSTAESYKRSFQSIIRQRGYSTLLNALKKKISK